MNTTRNIAAYALTALLLGGSAGGAFAQTAGTGGGPNVTAPATSSAPAANRDNDRGFDWGWLGLLGLIGLAGLMRRDRTNPNVQHRPGVGTTRTAAR